MRPIALLPLLLLGCTTPEDDPTDAPSSRQRGGDVEYSAETMIMESFPVQLRTVVTARNTSDAPVVLRFGNPCVAMIHVYADSARAGEPVWSQERFIGCAAVVFDDTVAAGDTAQYAAQTDGYEVLGDSLPDGRYWLTATLRPDGVRLELPAGVVDLAVPRE